MSSVEHMAKHFGDNEWADFARNTVSPKLHTIMHQHIDAGCKQCSAVLRVWQQIAAFASAEANFTPPSDVVRVVKSQFAAVNPEPSRGVRLVFDSSLQPAAIGIRGFDSARQLLYETDEYYIDLRLEARQEAERACIVGQILNRSGEERAAKGAPVRLLKGKLSLAETTTNHFGEFQLEFEAASGLHILIGSAGIDGIVLPLYGVPANSLKTEELD